MLCDPALLLPPPRDATTDGLDFWRRVVGWSANRRLRVGPESLALVFAAYEELGWPNTEYPACPPPLQRLAHGALSDLLGRLRRDTDPAKAVRRIPTLSPRHQGGELVEEAIGHDAAHLASPDLVAIATSAGHWVPPAEVVAFDPPPPDTLPLVFEPTDRLDVEIDIAVAAALGGRRLTIVGGVLDDRLISALCTRFDLPAERVRWFESQPGSRVNLKPLDGLQPDRDVVFCVVGHIGHPESTKVDNVCSKRGIESQHVADSRDIIGRLRDRYGADASR